MTVLYLPGTAGNTVTCPDTAALSFAGDIDVRVKFSMSTYTPSSSMTLASKFGGAGQRTWSFELTNTGALNWTWSSDGTATTVVSSTVQVMTQGGFAPEEPRWARVTHDVSNGGNNIVTFYTSADGSTWDQFGEAVTTVGTTSLFNSNATVNVGMRASTGFPAEGLFYEAVVMEGIAGTIRANPDFTDAAQGWVEGDDAGDTGSDGIQTWTLAGAAEITAFPSNMFPIPAQLLVQVAFGTNLFSPDLTWADITSDVRTIHCERGKNYELDRIDTGLCILEVENFDGKYHAHNTASPYYPNVKPMVPVRVRAVYQGMVYPLWSGFVERWPVTTTADNSLARVECADLFKPLEMARVTTNNRTTVVNALSPVAWWRFGSTADETGGNDLTFAGSPTVGGAAGAWDGDVATTFDGSDDAATVASESDVERQSLDRSYEFWFRPTGTDSSNWLFTMCSAGQLTELLGVNFNGATDRVQILSVSGGSVLFNKFFDCTADEWHHLVVSDDITAGTYSRVVYLDGVNVVDGAFTDITGTVTVNIGMITGAGASYAGDISEIAVYPTALTQQQVSGLYAAQFEGFATELTSERIEFILNESEFVGGPITVYDLETGISTMDGATPTDVSALEAIGQATDTERGWFFIAGDGRPTFQNRHYRLTSQASPVATIDETDYAEIEAGQDDQLILNDIEVIPGEDLEPFRASDAASIGSFGIRPYQVTIYPDDVNEGNDAAHYILAEYKEPRTRISYLGFEIHEQSQIGVLLGAEIGNRYNVEAPMAGDDLDLDCYLEKVSHDITLEKRWFTSWQLSAATSAAFWSLGVTGLSELDQTTVLAY